MWGEAHKEIATLSIRSARNDGCFKYWGSKYGDILFQEDDISQMEYEVSFADSLFPKDYSMTVDTWDVAGNHLHRTVRIQISTTKWRLDS